MRVTALIHGGGGLIGVVMATPSRSDLLQEMFTQGQRTYSRTGCRVFTVGARCKCFMWSATLFGADDNFAYRDIMQHVFHLLAFVTHWLPLFGHKPQFDL